MAADVEYADRTGTAPIVVATAAAVCEHSSCWVDRHRFDIAWRIVYMTHLAA